MGLDIVFAGMIFAVCGVVLVAGRASGAGLLVSLLSLVTIAVGLTVDIFYG